MAITPNTTFSAGAILTAAQMNRLPWGIVGYASKTTSQTGILAEADVTGLSVTWTAVSTRYYRTSVFIPYVAQATSAGYPAVKITDGSNSLKQSGTFLFDAGQIAPASVSFVETGISGSVTRKIRATTNAGTMEVTCAATYPAFILVEDLGQA